MYQNKKCKLLCEILKEKEKWLKSFIYIYFAKESVSLFLSSKNQNSPNFFLVTHMSEKSATFFYFCYLNSNSLQMKVVPEKAARRVLKAFILSFRIQNKKMS